MNSIKSLCCESPYREEFWQTSKTYRCNRCNKRCRIGDPENSTTVKIPYYGHAQIVKIGNLYQEMLESKKDTK